MLFFRCLCLVVRFSCCVVSRCVFWVWLSLFELEYVWLWLDCAGLFWWVWSGVGSCNFHDLSLCDLVVWCF